MCHPVFRGFSKAHTSPFIELGAVTAWPLGKRFSQILVEVNPPSHSSATPHVERLGRLEGSSPVNDPPVAGPHQQAR